MLLSPNEHGVNNRNERHAQFGNGVLAAWRQFGIDGFDDQPVVHQFFELYIQHSRRGLRQRLVQFTRTHGTVAQLIQDAGFPFGVNQTDSKPQWAIQINGYLSFVHKFKICCKDTAFFRITQVYTQIIPYPNNFSVLVYMVILL